MHTLSVHPAKGETTAVALLLHGGRENSHAPVSALHSAPLRMIPFARHLEDAAGGHGLAVWRLRYAVRGWNGDDRSPVTDVRSALDGIRAEHGDAPVVVIGHSMGGRAAAHVVGDPSITGMVALAPWLPQGEPVDGVTGKHLLVAHGDRDRITSNALSLAWCDRARAEGADVTFVRVAGAGHYLFRRVAAWNDLVVGFTLRTLGIPVQLDERTRDALVSQARTVTV